MIISFINVVSIEHTAVAVPFWLALAFRERKNFIHFI